MGKCFNYGKQGHKLMDCRFPKWNNPKEANVIDDITKYVSDNDLTAVIFEMNLVGLNPKDGGLILVLPAMHALQEDVLQL